MGRPTVLTVVGSLRRDSVNRRLRDVTVRLAGDRAVFTHWDGLAEVPPFSEDDEATPTVAVDRLRQAVAAADAVLLVTPEYNGSLPGQLKNALDWASRPRGTAALAGKPVAVIGASPSPGGTASAQEHARVVLTRSGAEPVSAGLAVPRAYDELPDDGTPPAPWLAAELAAVLDALCAATDADAHRPVLAGAAR